MSGKASRIGFRDSLSESPPTGRGVSVATGAGAVCGVGDGLAPGAKVGRATGRAGGRSAGIARDLTSGGGASGGASANSSSPGRFLNRFFKRPNIHFWGFYMHQPVRRYNLSWLAILSVKEFYLSRKFE